MTSANCSQSVLAASPRMIVELRWAGPFGWPGLDSHTCLVSLDNVTVASKCGIYLWTTEYLDGFLVHAAGITRRSFVRRLREHTRGYQTGIYTLLDIPYLKQGVRKEIWHGFWMKTRTAEKENEYEMRREELRAAADEQLGNYRLFVAIVDPVPRVLERIEASIMNILYNTEGPFSAIPDRGMALAPRWPQEAPITVRSISSCLLHAVPPEFEV